MSDLFGRYCYIDTPWIAGKKTRYRIIGSGVSSNAWCEAPVTGRTELIHHDNMEEVVFVVLDTLISDDSIVRRFALKDVDVMPADVRPVVRGKWEIKGEFACCTVCKEDLRIECGIGLFDEMPHFCPNCGSYNGGDGDDQH